jgi:hypothetical protein
MGVLGHPDRGDEGEDDPSVITPGPLHQVVDLKGKGGLADGREGKSSSPIPGSDLVQPEREAAIAPPGLQRPDGGAPRREEGELDLRRSGAWVEDISQRYGDWRLRWRELDGQLAL